MQRDQPSASISPRIPHQFMFAGRTLSTLEARDGRAWGGPYTTRLQRRHRFFRYPVRGRNAQWRRIRSQAARQGIVLRSKGARDSIPVQPRIKIMRGPTHVGARVSFDLEIYRRLLAAIALDLIFNGLSFVE